MNNKPFIFACPFAMMIAASRRPTGQFRVGSPPILAARGCSTGPCHGKQRGQNGFQLSLLGFDSDFDYNAIVRDARGRRVFPTSPKESLLLRKATGDLPHGGGRKLAMESEEYRTLLRWIESGLPRTLENEPTLEKVTVSPTEKYLKPGEAVPLVVTAHYSDATRQDVTSMAMYQSNESAIVSVDETGLVQAGPLPGEATIMARYMNVIATCNVAIPLPGDVPAELYTALPVNNFIDGHVWEKLQTLGITPSEFVDDAKFMRRVYVDIIELLRRPKKRARSLKMNRPQAIEFDRHLAGSTGVCGTLGE
ncbi:MAG: Ig-like domain-containing protein [Pirellulaceae bacterium]